MDGARVGITAARRAQEQAALVRSLGGVPHVGPAVGLDAAAAGREVAMVLAAALTGHLDAVVMLTGVGARHLMRCAEGAGLAGDLVRACVQGRVLARGPKARRALERMGLPVHWTASPAETRVVERHLLDGDPAGMRILVQCVGAQPEPMVDRLRAAGAEVFAAHPYAIAPPGDGAALRALLRRAARGDVEALTFTSAMAADAVADRMEAMGLDPAPGMLVAAVGPVTRDALLRRGWRVDVEPRTPRMGAMYQALAARLAGDRAERVA